MNITKDLALFIGLAAAFLTGGVRADTLSDTASAPLALTEISGTLSLKRFNVPGAILDSITLSATSNTTNSGSTMNTAAQVETFKFTFLTDVTLTGPNAITLDPTPTVSQTFKNVPAGATVTIGPLTATDTQTVPAPAADFSLYIGAGNFTLPYASLSGIEVAGGGGNIVATVLTKADVSATVTYRYHRPASVPEPGGMALLIAGGVTGAGLFVRRRK